MKKQNNLTEGDILKTLIVLAVPIILSNILQTAYQLTDAFWVGRLGTDAVAAVSISFPLIFLIVSLGGGLAMAGTILVAQYKGKGDQRSVNHITSQTMMAVVVTSVLLAILGYFSTPYLIQLIGAEVTVVADAVAYMKISFIGMIFMFTYMIFQALMRGVGNVNTPMYIVLGTVILNLFLDPLFIFGYGPVPAFGVGGAAMSTIITQGIAAIIGIVLLVRGKYGIKLSINDLRPDLPLIKKMFKLGFPVSIEQSTRSLGLTVMTFLVASFGTLVVAAYGIGFRILSLVIIPAMGLSMATSTLVGQNIGAKKIDRVEKIVKLSSLLGFITLSILGVIIFIFASQLSAFFIPGEIETIKETASFVRIMALSFGFIGLQMTFNGVMRGTGSTMASMMFSIISLWALRFPVAYVLSMHTNLAETGIWIAFPVTNVIAVLLTGFWFMSGSWKEKSLVD